MEPFDQRWFGLRQEHRCLVNRFREQQMVQKQTWQWWASHRKPGRCRVVFRMVLLQPRDHDHRRHAHICSWRRWWTLCSSAPGWRPGKLVIVVWPQSFEGCSRFVRWFHAIWRGFAEGGCLVFPNLVLQQRRQLYKFGWKTMPTSIHKSAEIHLNTLQNPKVSNQINRNVLGGVGRRVGFRASSWSQID